MARALVTVGEFPNAMLAELARGRLEEEGIPAEVSGAMAQTWAGGDVPLFGVRLEVLRADLERARAILDQLEGPPAISAEFEDDPGEEGPGADGTAEGDGSAPAPSLDVEPETEETAADAAPGGDHAVLDAERRARRALIVTLLSLFLWVLVFWAIVVWVGAVFDREAPLSRKGKVSLAVAIMADVGIAVLWCAFTPHSAWWWALPWVGPSSLG